MSSRDKRVTIIKRKTSSIALEKLDSRILLSVNIDWHQLEHDMVDDFFKEGYGHPDPFFSDPSTWDGSFEVPTIDLDKPISDDNPVGHGGCSVCLGCGRCMSSQSQSDDQQANPVNIDPVDLDDVFAQSAEAYGQYVLYLDFDGAQVASRPGDFWLGANSITVDPFSLDAFGWGGQEAMAIDYITEFVREDYTPYNIEVTNLQPAGGQYTTIYVGGSNDWFRPDSGIIGVATYDVGNRDASNYGFAFTEELGIYKTYSSSILDFSEYIANLVTHEAAHTFGANHVSDITATMNPYLPLSPQRQMFGRGNIPNSSAVQDTQEVLGETIGYAHSQDDYGDTLSTASPINLSDTVSGVLERRDDSDAFTFIADASGSMTVDLDTGLFANLDAQLSILRNSDAQAIAYSNNYQGSEDPFLSFDVTAGQDYTLLVSSYGGNSLGSYSIAFTVPQEPPRLAVTDSVGDPGDHAIDFGSLMIGREARETFTLSNTGSSDLVISSITGNGLFTLETPDGAAIPNDEITIQPGDSTAFTVVFTPEITGTFTGAVEITSNDAANEMMTLLLSGYGAQPQPDISVSGIDGDQIESNLILPDIQRGQTGSGTLIVQNNGTASLAISDIQFAAGNDFFQLAETDYDTELAAGQTLTIPFTYTAAQRGFINTAIIISSNDPDQPQLHYDLQARVTGGVLAVADSSGTTNDLAIDFGDVYLGEETVHTVTLTNDGDAYLTIQGVVISGPFDSSLHLDGALQDDDIVLSVGESLEFTLSYEPSGMEDATGTLTILTDNIEDNTAGVNIEGRGHGDALEITESDGVPDHIIDAGEFRLARDIDIKTVHLTNHGNQEMTIALSLADGTVFQIDGPETITLAAGESTTVSLVLSSFLARSVDDMLTLTADDYNQTAETYTITAAPYALVGGRDTYTFIDQSGDLVTIMLKGDAQAKVTLGGYGKPDIESIEVLGSHFGQTRPGIIVINVERDGSTDVGSISGDVDLKLLFAPQVNLVGAGLDWDGVISSLRLNAIENDAVVQYRSDSRSILWVDEIADNAAVTIDGTLRMARIGSLLDGADLIAVKANKVILNEMEGNLTVNDGNLDQLVVLQNDLAGTVQVEGSIKFIKLGRGDMTGQINVTDDLERLILPRHELNGTVNAGRRIGMINAGNIHQAAISAVNAIDNIITRGDMTGTDILIGFSREPLNDESAPAVGPINAMLGNLNIKGVYAGSTVAVGVAPEASSGFLAGQARSASGSIGSVNINHLITQNADLPFGLIAKDSISKVKIERQHVDAEAGFNLDDFFLTTLSL